MDSTVEQQMMLLRQFSLTHKGLPIFNRNFDGSDTTITNTTTDKITIPNHFFVTGEPVLFCWYWHSCPHSNWTHFLHWNWDNILLSHVNSVFVIKDNDSIIRLASSAENGANKATPVAIGITGVDLEHSILSHEISLIQSV